MTNADLMPEQEIAQCFLCVMDHQTCQVPMIEGKLVGARIEERNGKPYPFVGLVTVEGEQARVNLRPEDSLLVQRLMALPEIALRSLHFRALHLIEVLAKTPAPGKEPFRVFRSLSGSLAIIEPDLLLNITDLSHGNYCMRQEVLRQLFPGVQSAAGLRGTLIHNIFKEMLKGPDTHYAQLLADGLRGAVVAMAEVGATEEEVRGEVIPHLESLEGWRNHQRSKLWGSNPRVRAETFLMAPEIGLKGRLDILWEDGEERRLLELKTGKASGELPKTDHRWQVNGYHALLSARRNGVVAGAPQATLLYSSTPQSAAAFGIPVHLRDIQRVMGIRNELALVRVTGRVPPPPGGMKCERCFQRPSCGETSQLLGWEPPPGDLPPPADTRDAEWFRHWFTLQQLEGRVADNAMSILWHSTAAERIAAGAAIGGLELAAPPVETMHHEWNYTFRCDNTSELREGDEVLISDGDPVRGEVVSGSILRVASGEVVVWAREQILAPALIDRYSADVVNRRMLHNLTRWLHVDSHHQALVRGEVRPRFDLDPPPINPLYLIGLNGEQATAVTHALTMKDYLLIQGPPGTGKTKVIAAIAQMLLSRGYRVALAAFTNQATDTMLARVIDKGITNAIRLGHEFAVAPHLRSYRLLDRARALTKGGEPDAAAVRAVLRSAPVVAATVATWSAEAHEIEATMPLFDVVIVDEATQLTIPAALGALRWAKRFILVGDERQLPPLVQSEAARAGGLGDSLFEKLLSVSSDASVALRRQYRMSEAICDFPSQRFYQGKLIADSSVAEATLSITPVSHEAILDPHRSVVWVDVPSSNHHATKLNDGEAQVAATLARALIASGVEPSDIGIIAPFRAQVARIRQLSATEVEAGLMIDTVDRFQGGECAVIILSLVAATPPGEQIAAFLDDPHRLNVALTRAKQKLIVIGHRAALADLPNLRALASYCEQLPGGITTWE